MDQYKEAGFDKLPICIAKTQYSFSCDPAAKGSANWFCDQKFVRFVHVLVLDSFIPSVAIL
jgi:formyltetrahydrofolate synthetase